MDEAFINKVRQTILNHLEDEKFSIDDLASEIGFSKSQMWRKVKASIDKSVNQLIREIRLQEAAKLIEKNTYTASEIAYKVGFRSPSYFNKCFHDYFGITPGDYKEQKEEVSALDEIIQEPANQPHSRSFKFALLSFIILALLIISYLIIDKPKPEYSSIVILPFLDLSENRDQDYLADGITEQITLELSKRNDLRVISRTSAMNYKGKNKLSSDIAKELGVDYLLEGSVMHGSDSIRIIVQLIEPFPKEKNIWQKSYIQKVENVLNLVKGISTEIATEINVVVSPKEINKINYVVNPEAYEFYLKGLHLWNQQTPKSIKRSFDYLNKSIQLDSNFAPTYMTLAEAYISLNMFNQDSAEKIRNVELGREAVNKALQKDSFLAEAYITKGNIVGKFDWNWEEMKRMTKKGLQLDPNNSYGHTQLSKYYLIKNDLEKAINEALIAEKLDPLNPRAGCIVAEQYFFANKYEESIIQFKKVLELFPNHAFAWDGLGYVQFITGQKEESKYAYQKFQEIMKNESMIKKFETSSLEEAIDYWIVKAKGKSPLYCSNPSIIAQASLFLNRNQEALDYLEIAYSRHDEDLPRMMLKPHFSVLYNEPRFLDLVEKTNIIINISIKP